MSPYGNVLSVRIIKNKNESADASADASTKAEGTTTAADASAKPLEAFVEFKTEDEAKAAVSASPLKIGDKEITIITK
jgi:hypothetical protein